MRRCTTESKYHGSSMSLIGKVGRKRPRARIALAALYLALSLGAITTLYPFLLMAATSLKGPTDQNDNALVPKFLKDEAELLTKYVDDKYAGNQQEIEATRTGPASAEEVARYRQMLRILPLDHWRAGFSLAPNQVTSRLRVQYQSWLRSKYRSIEDLNRAYLEEAVGFQTIDVPAELLERKTWQPPRTRKYGEWLSFKASLPLEYRIPVRTERLWQVWLRGQFRNQLEAVPTSIRADAKSFEQIKLPSSGALLVKFRRESLPDRFRFGATERWWGQTPMPIEADERTFLGENAASVRNEFAFRNHRYVLDYILLNGRAVFNTVLFCGLAILAQLTVNPLAAYALSRFPFARSGQVLLFLLATMAFPAEVAMIPSFLLLKDLGLLNTFAALVLPTAASGYMIFLLKGFFDSLPSELFEAAQLDGAPERTMMLRIAFPLSRPVLGYLALLAFMGAYGAFLYAFLIAQDQKMWTLMVWIYQLQAGAPRAVMMAALTLAVIPTLAVFLAAQRVILRGIVLPGER